MIKKLLFVIVVSVVALFFLDTGEACTPLTPSRVVGPVFGSIGEMEDELPLLTTTKDFDFLGATLTLHNSGTAGGMLPEQDINVTIHLDSGAVTAGWPDATANRTIPPPLLDDPTGGYTLTLDNITAILTHQNSTAHDPIEIELYAPDYARSARHSLYFFVSWKLERAYIFYVTEIDCSGAKVVNYIPCKESPRAIFEEFWVTIVDVADGSYFFQPFGNGFGVFLPNPGPSNSLTTVYEEIQVAMVSPAWGGCGSGGYIFYDINAVVELKRFGKGLLHSLQAFDDPRDLSAYTIRQNTEVVSVVNESSPTTFISEFSISQISVVTGRVIRVVKLDADDLYSLSDFDPADLELATSMSPRPDPTPSPTALLPSPAPTKRDGSPANSSTQSPSILMMSSLLEEAPTRSDTKTTLQPSSRPSVSPVSPPGQGFSPPPFFVGADFSPSVHPSVFRPIGLPTIEIAGGQQFPSPSSMFEIPRDPPMAQPTSSPLDSAIFPTRGPKPLSLSPATVVTNSSPIFVSTRFPSISPTKEPTTAPTSSPPTLEPTELHSSTPTELPTRKPTELPTVQPSLIPTETPTQLISDAPSVEPTNFPSHQPVIYPSAPPSYSPTKRPSIGPTFRPTFGPTHLPTPRPVLPTNPPFSIPEGFVLLTAQPIGSFRTEPLSLTEDAVSSPVTAPPVTVPTSVAMIQSPAILPILTWKPVSELSEPPLNPVNSYFFQSDPSLNTARSEEEAEEASFPSRGPLLRLTATYSPSTSPLPPTVKPSQYPLVATYPTAIVDGTVRNGDETSDGRGDKYLLFAMGVSVSLLLFTC